MSFRLYVVPVDSHVSPLGGIARQARYVDDGSMPTVHGPVMTFGTQPWAVFGGDLSVSDDNTLVGLADVLALPFDLSTFLSSGQVGAVKTFLEAANIPAGWVTTAFRWLEVTRILLGMLTFQQRLEAVSQGLVLFAGGVTLATTFGSLPTPMQDAMIATAQGYGFSTAGLTGGTTLRVILKTLADNFAGRQYNFNGTLI